MKNLIEELENKTLEPDFWSNQSASQSVLVKIKQLKDKLSKFEELEELYDETCLIIELGNEANDAGDLPQVIENIEKYKHDYEILRLETLLTGEYDANDCVLTIHSGEGGTEAQDWTEMLLRMYTRWGEDHGFDVKLTDFLDGEEADLDEILNAAFVLNMDSQLLCREDCKGLCSRCGKDLNEGPCGCKQEIDPRLAVLAQLLEK